MRIKKIAAFVAAPLIILLAGCSSSTGATSGTPADTGQAPATTAEQTQDSSPRFGQTYTWPDGTAVTISAPEAYTPSQYAIGPVDGYTNLKFSVTLVNNTDDTVNTMMFTATVLSGGKEGPQIISSADNVGGSMVDVPAGKSVAFDIAYSVADPDDISMTVSPGILSDKVTFTN